MKTKKLFAFVAACSLCAMSLPLSAEELAADTISGSCGENVSWEFDESTRTLTISGTGDMAANASDQGEFYGYTNPWTWKDGNTTYEFPFRSAITSIIIEDGVTSIGDYAFLFCDQLTSVTIPDSVTSIGEGSFCYCETLESITLPSSVSSIGMIAFWNCTGMGEITIQNPLCKIYDSDQTISENTVICCYEPSTASQYAEQYGRATNTLASNRPLLSYAITDNTDPRTAEEKIVSTDIPFTTISNLTSYEWWPDLDRLQECKDSAGNLYAVCGDEDFITVVPENADEAPFEIENAGFTFGAATIDDSDSLYVLWGYSIPEENIETELENGTENIVVIKYDLSGNVLGQCYIPITTSLAQYPFDAGNASMAVKDDVVGCFFNTEWTQSYSGDGINHQGAEFAGIDRNTMELVTFSDWEGSHSFGVSLIPTDYGFAGIQKGDATARGLNFSSYLVSGNQVQTDYLSRNGYTLLFNASGQYGTNEAQLDGNATYLHMGGLAKSATTYAVAGKSERVYSTMSGYGDSDLRTYNYDVFLKIADQTLADTAAGLAGEERVDVETGETANYNIIWLTECNDTEKAGQVKVVTLADGSYCVLWEKFVNDEFDSIRYVITDECGNILRPESTISGARLSRTSVQPFVDGYTLKWAAADDSSGIHFYSVNLNEVSNPPLDTTDTIAETTTTKEETTTTEEETTTTAEETTTTAQETSTTAQETTTATEQTTPSTEPPTVSTDTWYASKGDYISWAVNDYTDKTGGSPAGADILQNEDGTIDIILSDENGEILEIYTINPVTGIGEDRYGNAVNLPQTGLTSPWTAVTTFGSGILILAGATFIFTSKRRKENKKS